MATHLDIKLSKIKKELDQRMPGGKPSSIEEYLVIAGFPEKCTFNIKKLFQEIFLFYRQTKQRTEPDLILWIYIRDVMLSKFKEYGDNENKYFLSLKQALGYDRNRPHEDWQAKAGKEAEGDRLDRQDRLENIAGAEQRVEKQSTELREIPKEDLDKILENTPEENYILHPRTRQRIKETEFYSERKEQYKRDFHFNESSDEPLVNEVIMREIQLIRLDNYLQDHPNRFIGKHRDEVFQGLTIAQKALGISREQRVESEEDTKDTLADAVDTYEKYEQCGIDLETMFVYEHLEMLLQKFDRGEMRGSPEISEANFKWLTRGVTVDEARAIVNDPKNKKLVEEIEEAAARMVF